MQRKNCFLIAKANLEVISQRVIMKTWVSSYSNPGEKVNISSLNGLNLMSVNRLIKVKQKCSVRPIYILVVVKSLSTNEQPRFKVNMQF